MASRTSPSPIAAAAEVDAMNAAAGPSAVVGAGARRPSFAGLG